MRASSFTPESNDGFLVERSRDNMIEGRYIEKMSYQEVLDDPFGNKLTFDRLVYRQVMFVLFSDFPGLEMRDAPRSAQGCVSRLLQLCDFSASIAGLNVDVLRWIDAFCRETGRRVVIDSLRVSGIEIDAGVLARIVLTGSKDVRAALKDVTRNRPYQLDKAQAEVQDGGRSLPVQFSATGSVAVRDEDFEELYPSLRASIRSVGDRR
jgi:hypothetical protein